ncbi:hypothetical protein FOCC_FOCC007661 [Frankliniella occidentalis]|nr:hypothetical protein FOCC_FOCC007661 [Frankliniella occidentalis]
MDLELIRVDYSVSGITLPSTMELLPASGARLSQKVIIGDQEGVLQSFSMKKGEQQMVFKTLPGTPISRVCLGGAIGTIKDKIFISKRGEVHGYTKKGKLFLGFDTCLAESIKSMHVNASTLLLSGNTVYNQFRDCEDTGSFLSTDTINDVIALPGEKTRSLVPVLACADGVLRVLDGAELESQSRQARSQPASARSPSTALRHEVRVPCAPTVLHLAGQDGGDTGQNVLFGTDDGRVGMVTVTRNTTPSWRWLVDAERPGAAVSSLHCHDLAGDGDLDLIVGRDDGSVEVYATTALDPSADASSDHDVHRRFTYSCPESVSSVRGGVLGTQGYDEVVVSSYTGMVFGLTTERVDGVASMDSQSVSLSQDARRRLQLLRAELGALEEKVSTERDRYLAAAEDGESALSVVPYLNINHKSDNKALVTFRCQMNTTRLDVRLRTVEGRAGHLRVYVTPLVAPKCAALRVLFLPPLSLHARAHRDEAGADARPYSVLTLRGHFSLAEMHAWLAACLPDLSEKPPAEPTTLCFQNACMSTMLICSYGGPHALRLMFPVLREQAALHRDLMLLDALRDLDKEALAPKFLAILDSEDDIRERVKRHPTYLDRLCGMLTDLYIDHFKFRGVNVKGRVPQLLDSVYKEPLDTLLEALLQHFQEPLPDSRV